MSEKSNELKKFKNQQSSMIENFEEIRYCACSSSRRYFSDPLCRDQIKRKKINDPTDQDGWRYDDCDYCFMTLLQLQQRIFDHEKYFNQGDEYYQRTTFQGWNKNHPNLVKKICEHKKNIK